MTHNFVEKLNLIGSTAKSSIIAEVGENVTCMKWAKFFTFCQFSIFLNLNNQKSALLRLLSTVIACSRVRNVVKGDNSVIGEPFQTTQTLLTPCMRPTKSSLVSQFRYPACSFDQSEINFGSMSHKSGQSISEAS